MLLLTMPRAGRRFGGPPGMRTSLFPESRRRKRSREDCCRQATPHGGRESPQSRKIARFATKLSKTLGIPVILWDERLTSFAAEQHLEETGLKWRDRKKHVDKVAAMFILQDYLDSQKP